MGKQRAMKQRRRFTAQSFCNIGERCAFAKQMCDVAADGSKAHDVFSFFCYFVAFNILYELHFRPGGTHWQAVKSFLEQEYGQDVPMPHPGGDERFKMLNGKVLSGRRMLGVDPENDRERDAIKAEGNRDIKVFLRILQIRNNLFHGSKDLNDSRDMPLIQEANVVLKEFLEDYFVRRGCAGSPEDQNGRFEEE